MEDARSERLKDILKRLGRTIKSSVHESEDVQECLEELHREGWEGIMALQAFVTCREQESEDDSSAALHVQVRTKEREVRYLLDASDAAFLESLGISPTKYRSAPRTPPRRDEDESAR